MRQWKWLGLLLMAFCFVGPARAQGVMFQDFYWDTEPPIGQSWWTHIERQLPALAKAGIGSVWVPAPYKGGAGKYDMGYGPYDLYDLGSKDQKGTVATRFGTKDEFLRFVAAAHRLGIKVYADSVLNHAMGADYAEPNPVMARLGWDDIPDDSKVPAQNRSPDAKPGDNLRSWTGFAPKGADGKPYSGRFPRGWRDFHPNEAEPNRNPPYHEKEFGEDYAFHGSTDYVRKQMIAWSHWFVAQTDIDGYRLDDVKGIEPDFIADFATQGPPNLWMVGEFYDGDAPKLMDYLHQTHDAVHLFDYPLYFALHDMTFRPETFDMRDLVKRRLPDRAHAVTFAGNHDVSRNDTVIVYDVPLAYAVVLAMSGTPMVYYSDFWRAGKPLQAQITRLVQAHDALATGDEIVRHADKTTLALERRGHLLAVFNSGGDAQTHRLTVPTAFGPHVRLTDYAGAGSPTVTDAQGRATISVAPGGYVYYAPAGRSLTPPAPKLLPTTQTWEFADDLDTGRLSDIPQIIRVTLVKGDQLSAALTLDGTTAGTISVVGPSGQPLHAPAAHVTLPPAPVDGVYQLRVRTTQAQKAHGTLTVRY
ncbi:MAG: alpha-amylase family glycosyl hydrolase [Armatimonadota bacterium]|nr:alpha-amylase family glycosyl hydrolase [Armatimonadota bacterium]